MHGRSGLLRFAAAVALLGLPAGAQVSVYDGLTTGQPASPAAVDGNVTSTDVNMLKLDMQRAQRWENEEGIYKQETDAEMAKDRAAKPKVEAEINQLQRRFTAPTLKKMLADPRSRYFVLMHWLMREEAAERREAQMLRRYQDKVADVQKAEAADRIDVSADEQAARDDYKKYSNKLWSEQELLTRWSLGNQNWNYGGYGYGGYGGYGYGGYGYGGYGYGGYGYGYGW